MPVCRELWPPMRQGRPLRRPRTPGSQQSPKHSADICWGRRSRSRTSKTLSRRVFSRCQNRSRSPNGSGTPTALEARRSKKSFSSVKPLAGAVPTQPMWLETIDGGPGYKIKKLRYEAAPGLWIPALLYEPTEFQSPKVPVSLAVNGHDRPGKAADYKQIRCINQAKRGMIVLNIEFLGIGQLNGPSFDHYRLNQTRSVRHERVGSLLPGDVAGTRHAAGTSACRPERVAVRGLSGGGWQTIVISLARYSRDALQPGCGIRPTADAAAIPCRSRRSRTGSRRSGNRQRLHPDDGPASPAACPLDEQHRRRVLLSSAEHTLPPLLAVVRPIYELYGKADNLRTHVNRDPGTHNFGVDNRQAFYAMLKDFFFADRPDVTATEMASQNEVKKAEQLNVALPPDNGEFHSLASRLMRGPAPRREAPRLARGACRVAARAAGSPSKSRAR